MAYDIKGNGGNIATQQGAITKTVIVNNFNQTVTSCLQNGDTKNTFFVGETVYASGSEYVPGESYNLYVFPHQLLLDGADIPTWGGFPIQVTADANGEFLESIWTPGSGDVGKYNIIVDYDGGAVV